MSPLEAVLADLTAEGDELDSLVAPLSDWSVPTPAAGWTIAHQIAHLAWTDEVALLAATDPAAFHAEVEKATPRAATFVDEAAEAGATDSPPVLLSRWRAGRSGLVDVLRDLPASTKLPWFGPPMSATSMASARLMETWAHGLDVADALGVTRLPTARLAHVVRLGFRTRDFAFFMNGLEPPSTPVRVELSAPGGEVWTFGPDDAPQSITGPALDFALRVTQRRHRADLALVADGPDADRWLDIAQAFAGLPGKGREPGVAS